MSPVALRFKSNDLRTTLEPPCLHVLQQFQFPDRRLICFFDDEDPACFARRFGSGYRGLHTPVKGSGYFPPYISRYFFDPSGGFAFDNVIYLRGSTCRVQAGAVITFAHELQHFVQYGCSYKALVANTLLYGHLPKFDPVHGLQAWDIPHEREAMIVSKRVAEATIGRDAVIGHASSQIAAASDAGYWQCFQSLSSASPFDLLAETKKLVEQYRRQLRGLNQKEIDFSKPDWYR